MIGLFKKVVVADTVAIQASLVFDGASQGIAPPLIDAWTGTLFYAFQLYFDFSGYSDMAIGLARMFGIRLPINFASPYKATSIIDFWRRWHITLSRFLREYLYFSLGGNRRGKVRRYTNVFLTMVLGGIWHGAGWTFLLWGVLHGFFIIVNQFWREQIRRANTTSVVGKNWKISWGRAITFLLVIVAWVPFRADGLDAMVSVYRGMLGMNGISLPSSAAPLIGIFPEFSTALGIEAGGMTTNTTRAIILIPTLLFVVWYAPNTQEIMRRAKPSLPTDRYPATNFVERRLRQLAWNGEKGWAIITAMLFSISMIKLNDISEFIYFQF